MTLRLRQQLQNPRSGWDKRSGWVVGRKPAFHSTYCEIIPMQITTVHTFAFSLKCRGNDQQVAALAIIKMGASSMGLTVETNNLPLPTGEDNLVRSTSFKVMSDDLDTCTHYWDEVQRALALIGVEATSP